MKNDQSGPAKVSKKQLAPAKPATVSTARKQRQTRQAVAQPKRDPNEREAAAIAAARASRALRSERPRYKEAKRIGGAGYQIEAPHSDPDGLGVQTNETFGTTSDGFTQASLLRLANVVARGGEPYLDGFNASLALVSAIAPQDELEAALAVQMAATHELSMEMLQRTKVASTTDGMREYGNLATKLSRTFTAQMKQLSDWRRGGEQVVRHVHVYEGGQAVVAETVNLGGRENGRMLEQPYGPRAALPCPDPTRDSVPIASHQGQAALSPARRGTRKRGAEG